MGWGNYAVTTHVTDLFKSPPLPAVTNNGRGAMFDVKMGVVADVTGKGVTVKASSAGGDIGDAGES